MQCPKCRKETTEESNYCPNCAFPLKLQLNPKTLSRLFGRIEIDRKWIHRRAQERLWEIGKDYGFWVRLEYEVPESLPKHARRSFVDVVWISESRVVAAFEIRIRKRNLDLVRSGKDIEKLQKLQAQEKFVVNVSETTGKAYFRRIDAESVKEMTEAYATMKMNYPRAYEKWTPEEDRDLARRFKEGIAISELAKMHQRESRAIEFRLIKMKLLTEEELA